jgi:hypothetical protein
MTVETIEWDVANQRALVRAMDAVRARLESGAGDVPDATTESDDSDEPSALDLLCASFRLSAFERDLLLLCAGAELDSAFAAAIARAHGDLRRVSPTFGLAMAALKDAHWSACTPDGPLRKWRLIEVGAGELLTTSPLRIDERVLYYLTGISAIDERLRGMVEAIAMPSELPASHHVMAEAIAQSLGGVNTAPLPVVQLTGEQSHDVRAVAAVASALVGASLYAIDAHAIPHQASERDAFVRLWQRESLLGRCGLLIDWPEADLLDREHEAAIARVLESVHGVIFVTRHAPYTGLQRTVVAFEVAAVTAPERQDVWASALGSAASALNGSVETLSAQFTFAPPAIRAACATALRHAEAGEDLKAALWRACRAQSRPRLDDLAQRITSAAVWDDLVVAPSEKQVLAEIAVHVRHRTTVYERWGFGAKSSRGLGISALFAGPSGTGKTMAGEVLANELGLDLYRIDLSQIVSKYIGETEKNLRRVFDAAEKGSSILLFDEADALFGKRSDVRDSHDRYANVEVSYLLQRMEAYRGLAILTTNMKHALDPAFMRRLRFVVHFPFPDHAQREEIWRRVFPIETPLDALEYRRLAKLQMTGGSIRNVAMNAAFLAAERGTPVRMVDVIAAARGEYGKLEQPLTELEVGA